MARKATPSGTTGRKRAASKASTAKGGRKSAAGAKAAPRKPTKAKSSQPRRASSARASRRPSSDMTAGEALAKLMESPLVADLLAVGATAALASIAGRGLGRSAGTSGAVAAAGKAAASAMGRRLTTEVEEIRAASRAAKGSAAD